METLRDKVLELGAFRAEIIDAAKVQTEAYFREMCKANACGNYGLSYMCPPDVGEIEQLMAVIPTFGKVLVYQTVGMLEDSYDFEGMMEAGEKHNDLIQQVRDLAEEMGYKDVLHLGAGGCRLCKVCGKKTGEPCRFPNLALASLEAYGINVSQLAEVSGMKYINGTDTVTYFGAMFFDRK